MHDEAFGVQCLQQGQEPSTYFNYSLLIKSLCGPDEMAPETHFGQQAIVWRRLRYRLFSELEFRVLLRNNGNGCSWF